MSADLFRLDGKTALITGSSRGLGRAMAEGIARAGAHVLINGTDEDRVNQTVAAFRAAGYSAEGLTFNVTDEAAVVAAFQRLDAAGAHVDILVNNAGIQFRKPLLDLASEDWRRVIDVNLTSAFLVGREAARRMVPKKAGKIINIGSLMSQLARVTIGPYTAAKGGIKMLTQTMTAEWAEHGIQTNAIGPGYMVTDLNQALIDNEAFNSWVKSRTPARRWGQPDELAGVAVFLASRASDYVSGQIIYVDGGMSSVL